MNSPGLVPMVYTCIISNFNVAEYESVLQERPSHLVLVVSEDLRGADTKAELFEKAVKASLPGIVVIRPRDRELKLLGASYPQSKHWMHEVLKPQLQALAHEGPLVCNFTGGTKSITLSITDKSLGWDWLHYKAEGRGQTLQKLAWRGDSLEFLEEVDLIDAPVEEVARLYAVATEPVPSNPLAKQPQAFESAKAIWHALSEPEHEAGKALHHLFQCLANVWSNRRDKRYQKKRLELPLAEWLGRPALTLPEQQWIQQWQQLAPESIVIEEGVICLPGNKSRDALKAWLSSDWIEFLVEQWLIKGGVPEHQVVANLISNPSELTDISMGGREVDVLVHYQGVSFCIEVKASLPSQNRVKGILQQIASLGERAGQTRKILFVGPMFAQVMGDRWEELEKRCKADNIMLCMSPEQLFSAVGVRTT